MTTIIPELKDVSINELTELFHIRNNFYYIFPADFIRRCFLETVDSIPFIDFTSNRKRTALKINPFRVNMRFDVQAFLAAHPDKDFRYIPDHNDMSKQKLMLIQLLFVHAFIDKLSEGLDDPQIVEAIKKLKISKKKLSVVMSTISSITIEDVDSPNDNFIFSYMMFI